LITEYKAKAPKHA